MLIERSGCHSVIHGTLMSKRVIYLEAHKGIDNDHSCSHLAIRSVLSCREGQSGRALGCSCSVQNFVEVLSLLYDPNQHWVLERTQHLEGEMTSVAFNIDTCMQPAHSHRPRTCINCRSDSAEQSKDVIAANSRFTEPRTPVFPKVPRKHSFPV